MVDKAPLGADYSSMDANNNPQEGNMENTTTLPKVSIGGYGSIVKDMDTSTLVSTMCRTNDKVETLKRELAAEMQRSALLNAELATR